ncbi:MAG TPA: NYN domain-containing protein, partial [Dissulfurispiraceae bacterium]|nr:NYN domain-containing protein [Dissulfurispiraceae bacterium]
MEKARDVLIHDIVGYRKIVDHDITVVFDGYKNGMATQTVSYTGGVKVVYSRLGERADDVIKKTVLQHRLEWIVVTADRDIADHAWAAGSVPVPPE